MTSFAEYFDLGKSQAELDFVDVDLHTDTELFLDPFALAQRPDEWCRACHTVVQEFFQEVVDAVRNTNIERARQLLGNLTEPNETRLGFSSHRPQGAGIGPVQAEKILEALTASAAVKTGFITALEESELMIEGVGRDKISDLATNVLRKQLAEYTQQQCILHNIPTQKVPLPPYFDSDTKTWISDYHDLPVADGKPVLLVPKIAVRYDPAYKASTYYQHFVLEFLRAEHLNANSSLVQTLRNGRRRVTKRALKPLYPLTKDFLFEFSRDHPEVLKKYRTALEQLESVDSRLATTREEEVAIAEMLQSSLRAIAAGRDNASDYHDLSIGAIEFIFFPNLIYPRKEAEIHEGRKRIDIVAENSARSGILQRLTETRKYPCSHVAIECKNYTREIANPELDQLVGRFSPKRGKVGFLFCRQFDNRFLFVQRCRDTFKDDQGLIIPFDDIAVIELLEAIENKGRGALDELLSRRVDEIWYS